jgi:predicted nucleic acid-binding protein
VRLVIDASVGVKWVIRDPQIEADANKAVAILRGIRARTIEAIEPQHWVAEILSVIARARPQRVPLMLGILSTLSFIEIRQYATYRRAADLSIALNHHLFDTLYHAVALEEGATLVTADAAYFGKAKDLGGVELLADFAI